VILELVYGCAVAWLLYGCHIKENFRDDGGGRKVGARAVLLAILKLMLKMPMDIVTERVHNKSVKSSYPL